MPPLIANLAMCLASTIIGIAAYDRIIVRPATAIGLVDTVQIYREQEAQVVRSLSSVASAEERAKTAFAAQRFAQRLPIEMARLAEDCGCLLVDRSVVVGMRPGVQDMTLKLRERVMR
jgi:hypothetical protein